MENAAGQHRASDEEEMEKEARRRRGNNPPDSLSRGHARLIYEEDSNLEESPGSSSAHSLRISRGPGNEVSHGNGKSGDRHTEDGSETVQRQNKGGPCPPLQETTGQAASAEAQPQTKKTAEDEIDDSSISLSRLRIKRSSLSISSLEQGRNSVSIIQQRPPIDFKKRAPLNMDSPASSAKKRDLSVSAPGDSASPTKKSKVDDKAIGSNTQGDKDEESDDVDYESEPDRFREEDTPPSDNNGDATGGKANAKAPAKTKAKKSKESKKEKEKKPQYKPTDKETAKPETARKNMIDRFNTLAKNAKYVAFHSAVVESVEDDALKKKISEKADKLWLEIMAAGISKDANPAEMSSHNKNNKRQRPDFSLAKKRKIQIQTQYDHPGTDETNRVNSPSETTDAEAEAEDGRDNLLLSDGEHTPEGLRRNTIVGHHKFEYPIYIANNAQNIARNGDIRDHATQFPKSFTDREQANAKLLELTQYENFEGDVAGVVRRNIFEYTPLKLLKAEVKLSTGEERVFWVDRHLVELRNLTKKERRSKKWSAKRPALPHFIVECEFMTRSTSETPRQPLDEDEGDSVEGDIQMCSEVVGDQTGDLELQRLPLATFTDRRLANDHAGALFLKHSAVCEEIRTPLDDFWWVNNAVAAHREAEKKAGEKDGLYVAEIYSMDMNTRLGFDWIRVAVYAVDDVTGPLNI
ncbi:uncharacterized protein F4807DRAFT_457826 [Annulohypoxylon truncatum]|uniref:uncharacterized protein n=1 Tax=Annulohypoxylon truncatum TaxID=327061 RepID=UPI002007325B|nr:uncharacterized protein F4807DRAFT_457826 [Annulohypoxylon truncatum]KAI1212327.1 hypothetical protein F4807DRAFT_457826 [Annulohypoxylon truncatum]